MPVEAHIDTSRSVVFITISGWVGMELWIAKLDTILSAPSYRIGMDGLIDIREADHQTDIEDIGKMARYLMRNYRRVKGAKIAIVTGKTVSYGLMRMLETQLLGLPFKLRVFYETAEAEEWLGLDTREGGSDG